VPGSRILSGGPICGETQKQAQRMVATGSVILTHPGEEDSTKRRQILDGARRVFMDLGFDGGSMGEIARAAGVSKGTLYVYFADKSSLFEAIVEQECLDHGKIAFNFDPARDAETTLRDFGRAYIEVVCRPDGGSAVRTVMAIAERMPDVGRRFYENVIALTMNRLATYLEAKVKTKELVIDDCKLAAMQFMMMCQATLFQPYIFQVKPVPTNDQIARVVESATRLFLAGYRPKT
jgi:AcrR family transcriptional regulator